MKLALVQSSRIRSGRAAGVQHLISMVRRAAKERPAPDLIVLPAGCDGGAAAAGAGDGFLAGVREALAFEARDWGVYIAAGLHRRSGGDLEAVSVLFDPDGDEICAATGKGDGSAESGNLCMCPCPIGWLGVYDPSAPAAFKCVTSLPPSAVVAVPTTLTTAGKRRRTEAANVDASCAAVGAAGRVHWAVVAPAGGSEADASPASYVLGPDGRSVVSVDTTQEAIMFADIPLEPAGGVDGAPTEATRDDRAD